MITFQPQQYIIMRSHGYKPNVFGNILSTFRRKAAESGEPAGEEMSLSLTHIWRHPLKAIGREEVEGADLTAGAWLPFDRVWAVAHDAAKLDGRGWAKKVNFLRGVTEPRLMAATARMDETGDVLTLDHPDAGNPGLPAGRSGRSARPSSTGSPGSGRPTSPHRRASTVPPTRI